jgi:hypothetical protein
LLRECKTTGLMRAVGELNITRVEELSKVFGEPAG